MLYAIIYGNAGTGKTYYLADQILKCSLKCEYVVLAATHAALENIYSICRNINPSIKHKRFYTLYSFFRIDYINENVLGPIDYNIPEVIFIDEFSLINKTLLQKCISTLDGTNVKKMILCGDIL